MTTPHAISGHTITLLRNGEEYFPRLIAAIEDATNSIYLETYIYAADDTGRTFSEALQRAARRGVVVKLLLDGFGSAELPKQWVDEMRQSGMNVLWFRKAVRLFSFRRYHLRRLHRKLALIDERIAFVSGININDDIPDPTVTSPRLDYAVEVQGPVVKDIHVAMQRLWMLVSWTALRRPREPVEAQTSQDSGQTPVKFLVRDNLRHRRDIERAYMKAIISAQSEIIIANAYFLPGLRMRRALLKSARRGVRVVLLLQGRVEYRLQHYATLALYEELLMGGVEIYEYQPSYLHAKVAVVDGYWATVGSSNIDPFSLWLAREANIEVLDKQFAQALRASLLQDIAQGAKLVTHSSWSHHGIWTYFLMRACYGVVRFLTGMTGYARGGDKRV